MWKLRVHRPGRAIQVLAHHMVDAGADVVFGHSSHHVQGVEVRGSKPIIYGAGGWIDDYALDEAFRWGSRGGTSTEHV
jgi:poly-gamma-glutamate capsule biosynthesis protein CapA/YwtB (metallophosphatase superfamily)